VNRTFFSHSHPFVIACLALSAGIFIVFVWIYSIYTPAQAKIALSTDAITETLKIVPGDGYLNDKFGNAIALDGNTLVIGARENNDGGIDAGAVYIYEQVSADPISWTLSLKLVVSDSLPLANFGASISLDGDRLAVGAPNDNGEIGAVYLFDRNLGGAEQWGQLKKLTPENGEAGDYFGVSVVLQNDLLFIGADGDDDKAGDAGTVYLFQRNQGGVDQWGFVKKIYSTHTDHGDHFGSAMAFDRDTLVVGAPFDDLVGANRAGKVIVFERNQDGADQWGEVKVIWTSDAVTDDFFGTSVAISGDYLAAGAIGQDAFGSDSGAVYIFFRHEGGLNQWGATKKIIASDGGMSQKFGTSVSMRGPLLLVGEPEDGTFITGNGAAYLYGYFQGGIGNWGEVAHLLASDAANLDGFGGAVVLGPNHLFVGARLDDDRGDNSGSVYVFDRPAAATAIFLPVAIR
jgi:hypothetical protein